MGGFKWYHMGGERGAEMEVMGVQSGEVMSGLKWKLIGSLGWEVTGALRWNVKEGLKWEVMKSDMEIKCEEGQIWEVMGSTQVGNSGGALPGSDGSRENMGDRDRRWQVQRWEEMACRES